MKKLLLLISFIVLYLSSVSYASSDNKPPPLKMPEQYLGYWQPYTKTAEGAGIDVKPDIIYHQIDYEYWGEPAPEKPYIRELEKYKVVHIDKSHVYMVTEKRMSKEWAAELYPNAKKHSKKDSYIGKPTYAYVSFSLKPIELPSFLDFEVSVTEECRLNEDDWNLPIAVHRHHILTNTCPNASITLEKDRFRDFSYLYVRRIDEGEESKK
jgi:hypothetical protein